MYWLYTSINNKKHTHQHFLDQLEISVIPVAVYVLKENQPRVWDDGKYELVIPGRPTRAQRVSVGRPGITSKSRFPFIICRNFCKITPRNPEKTPPKK